MKELRNALKPWVTGADRLRPREIAERVLSLPPNDRETALLRAARSVSYYHKAFWNTVFRDPRTPQGFLQAWVRAVEEGSWGCVAYTRDTLLRLAESAETPPDFLDYLAHRYGKNREVAERLKQNPNLSEETRKHLVLVLSTLL